MKKNNYKKISITASIIILLLVIFISKATQNYIHWEIVITEKIYGLSSLFLWPMLFITQIGNAWATLGIGIASTIRRRTALGFNILVGGGIAYILTWVLKMYVSKPRPFELIESVTSRETLTMGFGFPSGHTALAAALCIGIARGIDKKYRLFLYVLPVLVGISRIYLGVHTPLDVIAGYIIGYMATIFAGTLGNYCIDKKLIRMN